MKTSKYLILAFLLIFSSSIASAKKTTRKKVKTSQTVESVNPSDTAPRAEPAQVASPSSESSPFGILGGAAFSLGSVKNEKETIPGRGMDALTLYVNPYWNAKSCIEKLPLDKITVGPYFDFSFRGQTASVASAGGQNLRGRSYNFGLGLGAVYKQFSFLLAPVFLGKYSLLNKPASGNDSSYSTPLGLTVAVGYEFLKNWSGDFFFQTVSYGKNTVDDLTTDLGAVSNKLRATNFGVGVRYSFDFPRIH